MVDSVIQQLGMKVENGQEYNELLREYYNI